jgi:hypothetical protein
VISNRWHCRLFVSTTNVALGYTAVTRLIERDEANCYLRRILKTFGGQDGDWLGRIVPGFWPGGGSGHKAAGK